MACRYTYNGKTYSEAEFRSALKAMPLDEAAKYVDGISAIPTAPFVEKTEDWTALALKSVLHYAAANGFDSVAWTPGSVQVKRYWQNVTVGPAVSRWKEVTKPLSIRELGDDVLGRKMATAMALEPVDGGVLVVLKHDQVLKSVVSRVPVDVVDILSRNGVSPEKFLRDGDVVFDRFPVDYRGRTVAAFGSAIRQTAAAIRAKLGGLQAGGSDIEVLPALKASDLGPREIAGLLDPERLFHSGPGGLPQATTSAGSRAEPFSGDKARPRAGISNGQTGTADLATLLNAHAEIVHGRTGLLQHGFEPPPGEGMKDFYDKIVPQVAEKIGKKFGAKVGTTEIGVGEGWSGEAGRSMDEAVRQAGIRRGDLLSVPSIQITSAMKASVPTEGFPLFNRMTEQDWSWYQGVHDSDRNRELERSRVAIRDGIQVNGAPKGVRVVDFEGDVPKSVLETMAKSMGALSAKVVPALRMISRVAGYEVEFGGFSPAGNMHGVMIGQRGKVYINPLATHQIALGRAVKERIPYAEAYGRTFAEVLIHEAAHWNIVDHGDAHNAEIERITMALGRVAFGAIVKDGLDYAADRKENATIKRMYDESVPGWLEGERRGREAAENARRRDGEGTNRGVPDESDGGSRSESRPHSQRGEGSSGAGDRREVGLREARELSPSGVDTPAFVRRPDGGVAEEPLLGPETRPQYLQRKGQDRLNRLSLGESAIKAGRGDTSAPVIADRFYGTQPRIQNTLTHVEGVILKPMIDAIKSQGLDFDLLGEAMKGDADARAKVAKSGKAKEYGEIAKKIADIYAVADRFRVIGGLDDASSIAERKEKRAKKGAKEHPLYEALQELERAVVEKEQNHAKEALAEFTEKAGPKFGTVRRRMGKSDPDSNAVTFKRAGETWEIDLADAAMAKAVQGLNADELGTAERLISNATRWVSRVNTVLSPAFIFKNKIRDVGSAVLSAYILEGAQKGVTQSVAAKILAGQKASWAGTREFQKNPSSKFAEGSPAWWAQQAHKHAAVPGYFRQIESIKRLESRLGEALKSGLAPKMSLRHFADMMRDVNDLAEASTRVSYYRALVESGTSPERAGDMARATLDVNKTGEATKTIGSLSPFFNSSVQGASRLLQTFTSTDPAVRKRAQATMGALVAAGAVMGMALAKMSDDDDEDGIPDSDQMPEWDTQRNLIIGGVKIPLPQGFSAPFYAGFAASKALRGRMTPAQAGAYTAQAFFQQFVPIQSPAGVAQPLLDIAQNKKFSGAPIRPIRYPGVTTPNSAMSFKSNTGASKAIAKGLNAITGGDEAEAGYVDISPGDIDYLAKSTFGALGKFMDDSVRAVGSLVKGEAPKRIPAVSDFIVDTDRNIQGRFYDNARILDEIDSKRKGKEKIVLSAELKSLFPNADLERATLTQLRKAMRDAGAEVSPDRKAWFVEEMERLDGRRLKAKGEFEAAKDALKKLDTLPDGEEKDARRRAILTRANRAWAATEEK